MTTADPVATLRKLVRDFDDAVTDLETQHAVTSAAAPPLAALEPAPSAGLPKFVYRRLDPDGGFRSFRQGDMAALHAAGDVDPALAAAYAIDPTRERWVELADAVLKRSQR